MSAPVREMAAREPNGTPVVPSAILGDATVPQPAPFPAVATRTASYASLETLTEGALAKVPEPATSTVTTASNIEHLREAIVTALATAGHSSAAHLLGSGAWAFEGGCVRVTVPGMGKKMLTLTVNAAAEKIIRQELQRQGAPPRFIVSGGTGTVAAVVTPPVIPAGSVQETAFANPLVKRAQELFNAEVRSVLDLRQK